MCSCKRHGDQYATCTCSCPHPAPTTPPPDDAARAEAERLYPTRGLYRGAYLRGRADERARIAARRDKAEEAIMRVRDAYPRRPDDAPSDEVTDAVLAALGVSDR